MKSDEINILLIDDDIIVHQAFTRAMEEKDLKNPLIKANDGEEGLAALRDPKGPHAKGLPVLIFLDINMPKMDGHEFLKELRSDPKLDKIPVMVITTSKTPKDMGQAYDMAVIGYVIKDELSESLEKALNVVEQKWHFAKFTPSQM